MPSDAALRISVSLSLISIMLCKNSRCCGNIQKYALFLIAVPAYRRIFSTIVFIPFIFSPATCRSASAAHEVRNAA